MKTLNTYTESQLSKMKLAEITDYYNVVSKEIGLKSVKKFSDKATAVLRTLQNQELYVEELNKAANLESDKINGMSRTAKLITSDYEPKEGSIIDEIYTAINDDMCDSVEEVVNHLVNNYKKPRSNKPVTKAFIGSAIKWCVNNDKLTLEE